MRYVRCVALAAVVIGAAVACHSDRGYSSGPSALIQDGNHDGNPFFFWLPPLVKQQAPTGQVFSQQLAPAVTITDLCSAAVVRTFAPDDVQREDGNFHVNWHTAEDNLDPSCTYRITTQVGSTVLGVADIDAVDGGNGLKDVNTGD